MRGEHIQSTCSEFITYATVNSGQEGRIFSSVGRKQGKLFGWDENGILKTPTKIPFFWSWGIQQISGWEIREIRGFFRFLERDPPKIISRNRCQHSLHFPQKVVSRLGAIRIPPRIFFQTPLGRGSVEGGSGCRTCRLRCCPTV